MLCRDPNDYVRETKKDIFKSNFTFYLFNFNKTTCECGMCKSLGVEDRIVIRIF